MIATMAVSILGSYSFSQKRTYKALTIKKAITVPIKIKSLTRSLLHLFTEARVKPVDAQNDDDAYDYKFAHMTLIS